MRLMGGGWSYIIHILWEPRMVHLSRLLTSMAVLSFYNMCMCITFFCGIGGEGKWLSLLTRRWMEGWKRRTGGLKGGSPTAVQTEGWKTEHGHHTFTIRFPLGHSWTLTIISAKQDRLWGGVCNPGLLPMCRAASWLYSAPCSTDLSVAEAHLIAALEHVNNWRLLEMMHLSALIHCN